MMKKYIFKSIIYPVILFSIVFAGCTDLDVETKSEITSANFPVTEEDFVAVAASVYSTLTHKNYNSEAYWLTQQLTTDQMILTSNGGNWYDAARWKQLYTHTYDKDNSVVRKAWSWGFSVISSCNNVLAMFETAEDSEEKDAAMAEIRAVRVYCWFAMMDLYGDIPLVTAFGDEAGERTDRAEVFEYLEDELLEIIPSLKTTVDETTYGRPTRWMAYAMLAKLYINSEIYTGTNRWNDVVTMCDYIITEATDNGSFALDADYIGMFDIDNGSQIQDFIYSVPYDCNYIQGQYQARWWLHPLLKDKYGLPYSPSGSIRTTPEFYSKFNDQDDIRNDVWLTGKQYYDDGTPITIETTKYGFDNRYTGSDGDADTTVQLEFTPEIDFRDYDKFGTGDDVAGRMVGYRLNKFYPDKNSTSKHQSNDVPVFRYADILLMKAEAILRGASATKGQTALSLVNMVRERAQASQYAEIDLDELLDERAREFVGENWRRNDLIRFGKFESEWAFKTDNDINHRVLPVPQEQLDLNPLLGQNPGYE